MATANLNVLIFSLSLSLCSTTTTLIPLLLPVTADYSPLLLNKRAKVRVYFIAVYHPALRTYPPPHPHPHAPLLPAPCLFLFAYSLHTTPHSRDQMVKTWGLSHYHYLYNYYIIHYITVAVPQRRAARSLVRPSFSSSRVRALL